MAEGGEGDPGNGDGYRGWSQSQRIRMPTGKGKGTKDRDKGLDEALLGRGQVLPMLTPLEAASLEQIISTVVF